MVLYGDTGAGKTTLVKAGVLPLLRRRVGDREFARDTESRVVLPFPDRRNSDRVVAHRAEVAIFFDAWSKTPLTTLQTRILNALPAGRMRMALQFSHLAESLAAWSKELDVRFLIVFDRFEEYLAASIALPGIRQFADDFAQAVNEPLLPANFLLLLPDEQALLERFGERIPSLRDDYLRLPPLHYSTDIPSHAGQIAEVYAPVGGEFPIKRQSGSETDRGNAAAKRDDQARQEQVRMRRRVARASCHRASGGRDARCNSP